MCDMISHRILGAGIYANIRGILMGSMLPYIAYMDPTGMNVTSGHVPPNGNHVTCGLRGLLSLKSKNKEPYSSQLFINMFPN